MSNYDRYDAEADEALARPRTGRRHDATCNGSQGPCDLCEEEQDAGDETIYPTPVDREVA